MQNQNFTQIERKFHENFATKVISIISTKGGTGKTTLTANLSAFLADLGFRVLMVDADVQPSLSKFYPLSKTATQGIVEFLLGDNSDANILDCISHTIFPNLDIILSNNISGDIQHKISQRLDRAVLLKTKMMHPLIRRSYDFVLIDTQGAVGALQDSASFAADLLVSPVMPETLSAREFLSGTYEMLDRLAFGEAIGLSVPPLLALIYAQNRTRDSREITDEIQRLFNQSWDGNKRLLNTIIPRAKAYTEAISLRLPVHCHDRVQTNKSECAFDVMHRLVYEIFPPIAGRQLKATCFHNLADLLAEENSGCLNDVVNDVNGGSKPHPTDGNISGNLKDSVGTSPTTDTEELFPNTCPSCQDGRSLSLCVANILHGKSCEIASHHSSYVDFDALAYPSIFYRDGHYSAKEVQAAIRLIVQTKFPRATQFDVQNLLDDMLDVSVASPFEYFIERCDEAQDEYLANVQAFHSESTEDLGGL